MRIRNALRKFDWKGLLGWMIATMVGVQLAAFTIVFSVSNLEDQLWSRLATATVAGGALGVAQWVWLRRRLAKGGWWIASTLLGWYLVLFLVTMHDLYLSNTGTLGSLVNSVGPLTIPLLFSLPQWVFMRRQFQKTAWLWIVARPVAWLAGFGLFFLASQPKLLRLGFLFDPSTIFGQNVPDPVAYSIAIAIFGFGYAGVTGAAFILIQMNQTVPEASNIPASMLPHSINLGEP